MASALRADRPVTSKSTIIIAAVAAALIAIFITGGAYVLAQPHRIPLSADAELTDLKWRVKAPSEWTLAGPPHPGTETWQLPDRHYLTIAGGTIGSFDDSAHRDDAVDSGIADPENDEQATQKFAWESLGLSPSAPLQATKLEPVTFELADAHGEPLEVEFALFNVATETEHVLVAAHVFNASGHVLVLTRGAEDGIPLDGATIADDLEHVEITVTPAA